MTTPEAAKAPDTRLDKHVLLVAGVVVLGSIMSILDVTVVAVAQDEFQTVFHTNQAGAAWSMTAYTLALATVIPLASWAANRFGTKKVYLTSLVLFLAGSALCAMAWNMESMVAFRVIQGLGGGLLMPVGMMILTKAAGPERVGSVMAVLGIPMLLGPIGGPILGGLLIEKVSWHWVFLINIPIGIIALVYAWLALKNDETGERPTIDWLGLVMLSPGLALFLWGVAGAGEKQTFATPRVLVPALIGLALIIGFIYHALTTKKRPLLDLKLFRNRTLAIAVTTSVIFAMAFFGAGLLYPQYFIGVRGETTLAAGLLLAPQGIGAMLTMPIGGKLTDKIGPGKIVLPGLTLILAGMIAFTQFDADTSIVIVCSALFVQGLGMGLTMMPIMSAALATLSNKQVPDGTTLMNVIQQASTSIGTASISVVLFTALADKPDAMKAILYNRLKPAAPEPPHEWFQQAAAAFTTPFTVAAILVAVTLIPAFFLPRKKITSPLVEEEMDQTPHIGLH